MDTLRALHHDVIGCRRCPRLIRHCARIAREKRAAFQKWTYWGKPVPGFGDPKAQLLIVGLAPAAHGANRTGRMFTGDSSASFLMRALNTNGFANQPDSQHRHDGLTLHRAFITAVARCAPPDNKPTPREIVRCRPFFLRELALLSRLRAILALGRIAFDGCLDALAAAGHPVKRLPFSHGAEFALPGGLPRLFVSYHPSRQNTQTGRLTLAQLQAVLRRIRTFIDR